MHLLNASHALSRTHLNPQWHR